MKPEKIKEWFGRHFWYVLENGKIRPAKDIFEAGAFMEDMERRRVDLTEIDEDCNVSTVFLCLDHNYNGSGPPILFETLVRGGPHDGMMWRFSSYGEAKKAHWEIVDALQAGEIPCPSVGEEIWVWRMIQEMIDEDNAGEEWKDV